MAALEPFLINQMNQKCSKLWSDNIEYSEVDNQLEKIDLFAVLVKDGKSVAGFSPY